MFQIKRVVMKMLNHQSFIGCVYKSIAKQAFSRKIDFCPNSHLGQTALES